MKDIKISRNGIEWGRAVKNCVDDLPDLKAVELCKSFISEYCAITKNINPRAGSSYHWKHVVEAWAGGYVANGDFIEAARQLGVPMKLYSGSPNVEFAFGVRFKKRLDTEEFSDDAWRKYYFEAHQPRVSKSRLFDLQSNQKQIQINS